MQIKLLINKEELEQKDTAKYEGIYLIRRKFGIDLIWRRAKMKFWGQI